MAGDVFLKVSVEDAELRQAMARMRGLSKANRQSLLTALASRAVTSTVLRFHTQTAPDGVRWLPSKRVQRKGGRTLHLRGYLEGSITKQVSPDAAAWGSPLRYAAAMNGGASIQMFARSQQIYRRVVKGELQPGFVRRSKANYASWATMGSYTINIPARQYLGISADDRLEWQDASAQFMMRLLNGGAN
jgi:phage gpG-like protein